MMFSECIEILLILISIKIYLLIHSFPRNHDRPITYPGQQLHFFMILHLAVSHTSAEKILHVIYQYKTTFMTFFLFKLLICHKKLYYIHKKKNSLFSQFITN